MAAGEIGETATPVVAASEMPDIYYIILDAYTRDDILAGAYGLNNRPFLQELEERGFYPRRMQPEQLCPDIAVVGIVAQYGIPGDVLPAR